MSQQYFSYRDRIVIYIDNPIVCRDMNVLIIKAGCKF